MSLPDKVKLSISTIEYLRNKIANVASTLNAHIGTRGASQHTTATTVKTGFMSPEQYNQITYEIPTLLNQLEALRLSIGIPTGSLVWFYGYPDDIPDGWELATTKEYLPMYNAGCTTDGTALYGNDINDTTAVGAVEVLKNKLDPKDTIKTVALYLIRKKDTPAAELAHEQAYNNNKQVGSEHENGMTYLPKGAAPTVIYNVDYGSYIVPELNLSTEYEKSFTFIKPDHVDILQIELGQKKYYFQVPTATRVITITRKLSAFNGQIEILCNGVENKLYNVTTPGMSNAAIFAGTALIRVEWSGNTNHYHSQALGSLENV